MEITFHYPPELLQLLVDTIPRLCRSKKDVLLFFKGAGVERSLYADLEKQLRGDRSALNKFEIARTIVSRLNEAGEVTLRERREILKRIVEFDDFSTCWPDDRLEAKGLVGEIRRVVDVKDSFTRMKLEREEAVRQHRRHQEQKVRDNQRKLEKLEEIKGDFYRLFADTDPQRRGVLLEKVLNRLFLASGISVRESFTRVGEPGEGVVEQIDGVVELDGEVYLVEMKWLKDTVGRGDVSQHLVNVFGRHGSRGIFISYSDYTPAAISTCKDALSQAVVVLCQLRELVLVLEQGANLQEFLKAKVHSSIIDKQPFTAVLSS